MESYRTEEEQVEALRKWWDENGRSTLFAVAVALALGFGWQGWQQRQQSQAEVASARYDELVEAIRTAIDESGATTARHLAQSIKQDFPRSAYARFAALHLAKLAVADGELAAAEEELRWVLTSGPDAEMRVLAELRLARVVAARGDPQGGLDILAAAEPGAFEPAFTEARGDMLLQLGEKAQAVAAYEQALAFAAAAGTGASPSLQTKLQSLTPVTPRELATTSDE